MSRRTIILIIISISILVAVVVSVVVVLVVALVVLVVLVVVVVVAVLLVVVLVARPPRHADQACAQKPGTEVRFNTSISFFQIPIKPGRNAARVGCSLFLALDMRQYRRESAVGLPRPASIPDISVIPNPPN